MPPAARAGIVEAVDASGEVLRSLREDPSNGRVVEVIEVAFSEAASRAAYTGPVFVIAGFGLSLLPPETRDFDQSTSAEKAAAG